MNSTIAQNIRHNRLIEIRQLIDAALADSGPLSSIEYAALKVAQAALVKLTQRKAA